MKRFFPIVLLFVAASAAADPADEVRKTEIAFAQVFADRDPAKFFAFIAADATFLGAKRTMAGKPEIVKVWSEYLKDAKPPFSWKPDRVLTNAAGDLGLSTGPVLDATGNHIADYSSIWQKQRDGTWKIVFDGPGSQVCAK